MVGSMCVLGQVSPRVGSGWVKICVNYGGSRWIRMPRIHFSSAGKNFISIMIQTCLTKRKYQG